MRTFSAELWTVAPEPKVIPAPELPEIAVVGRSNSGKSTLINVLLGQRRMARVSSTPGRTRAIVFFRVENRFALADLPGYGFARLTREEQRGWRELVDAYLQPSRPLRGVIALFDVRRTPDELDRALVSMLERRTLAWQAVWTKVDKLAVSRVARRCRELDGLLRGGAPGIAYSSRTRAGRDELLAWVEARLGSGLGGSESV